MTKKEPNLNAIHSRQNDEKEQASFLGFLQGVMCCQRVQKNEMDGLKARATNFIQTYHGRNKELEGDALDILENVTGDWDQLCEFQSDNIEEILALQMERLDLQKYRNELNLLEGFLLGIATDGKISTREAEICRIRINNCSDLREKEHIYNELLSRINLYIGDDVIDDDESDELCNHIARIVGDSFADTGLIDSSHIKPKHDFETTFDINACGGQSFVMTGEFFDGRQDHKATPMKRKFIEQILTDRGLAAQKGVNRSLDILFVSNESSPHYATKTAGTKILRARELNNQGCKIKLVSESLMWRSINEHQ